MVITKRKPRTIILIWNESPQDSKPHETALKNLFFLFIYLQHLEAIEIEFLKNHTLLYIPIASCEPKGKRNPLKSWLTAHEFRRWTRTSAELWWQWTRVKRACMHSHGVSTTYFLLIPTTPLSSSTLNLLYRSTPPLMPQVRTATFSVVFVLSRPWTFLCFTAVLFY